jgi:hypothetical protein
MALLVCSSDCPRSAVFERKIATRRRAQAGQCFGKLF